MSSFFFPWFSSRGPVRVTAPAVLSLPIAPWVMGPLLLIAAAGVIRTVFEPARSANLISLISGTVLMILPIVTAIALNIFAIWVSPAFIPSTWRRVFIGVSPGTGLWIALIGGMLLVTSLAGGANRFVQIARQALTGLKQRNRKAISLLLATVGLILYIASRYQPWVSLHVQLSSTVGERWDIPGYAIPVIGISSLVEISLLGLCLLWIALHHSRSVGVALVTVAWAPTVYGVAFVISSSVPSQISVTVPSFILKSLAQWSPQVRHMTSGYAVLPQLSRHISFSLLHSVGGFEVLAAGILLIAAGLFSISADREESNS